MTPGVIRPVADDRNLENQIEKQMGCMAGFLQLFDRHQILAGKRIYAAKRLPVSPAAGSTSPSERSDASFTSFTRETADAFPSSPETLTPAETPVKPLPIFDFKDGTRSSWKLREAPRLSLDSRLRPREIRTSPAIHSDPTADDADKNRRSPSVVARLMGLDALPNAAPAAGEPIKNAELRRSASESRVPRDLCRFADGSFFQKPPLPPDFSDLLNFRSPIPPSAESKPLPPRPPPKSSASLRKSFFDAHDVFPEPNRVGSRSLYGEIEKRLRMRGIDEPAKDLETLKQILEALQLKGLLHSKPPPSDRRISGPPIVLIKPDPKPVRRSVIDRSGSPRRNAADERRSRSRVQKPALDPNPPARRRAPSVAEAQRRVPAVNSKAKPAAVRSPRNRRLAAEDDSVTTASESSISSSSQFDFERSRAEYGEGRSLLERCDKLLNSIAAFTSAEQVTAGDQQPSPVSVLDSPFLGEESSPSPVMKRSIDFTDQLSECDEDQWAEPVTVTVPGSDSPDFAYVSSVVLSADRRPDSSPAAAFAALEKRHSFSPPSPLHRRLLFDTVSEILSHRRASPSRPPSILLRDVWLELRSLQSAALPTSAAADLNDLTSAAIRSDLASSGDHSWSDTAAEVSDAVLHIERLLFKDLIADTIRELADSPLTPIPRRKLVF